MSAPVEGNHQSKQRRLAPGERAWPRPCDTVSAPPACWWWSNASCWSATRSAATSTGFPPGGGFESECDESTKDTVRREFFEETGLRVDVGPLVYVREFAEPAAGRFHMELFYRIDAWRGEPTLANLKGLGGDEFDIREVGWIARDELPGLPSFYPAELADDVWSRLDAPTPSIRHLGLQR